jgi:transposase
LSKAAPIWQVVFGVQASREVKMHAVFMAEFHGVPFRVVAFMFGKSASSVHRWVQKFREFGDVSRKVTREEILASNGKLTKVHKDWLKHFVLYVDPLAYLQELQEQFTLEFFFSVHVSTISRALTQMGFTFKVIERRAMQIRDTEISRFMVEVNHVSPFHEQLLFLDEMSLDNRGLLRKKGWFFRNHKLVYQGTFVRSKRLSILAFLGSRGILEVFRCGGTFSRLLFLECVQDLLLSGKVCKYPGPRSVWIMDGASIHVSKELIGYLWAMGIYVLYLPAYAPFYNPIEIVFGLVKKWCRGRDIVKGKEALRVFEALEFYGDYDFSPIFKHCGYSKAGFFNPHINYGKVETLGGFEEIEKEVQE